MPMQSSFDFSARRAEERHLARIGGRDTLTRQDSHELQEAARRVLDLLSDLRWHSREEIINVSGQIEGTRRLRELRQVGHQVEKCRLGEGRAFYYRLIKPNPDTG